MNVMFSFRYLLKSKQSLSESAFVSFKSNHTLFKSCFKTSFLSINSNWILIICDNNTEAFTQANGLLTGPLSIQPIFVSNLMIPAVVSTGWLLITDQWWSAVISKSIDKPSLLGLLPANAIFLMWGKVFSADIIFSLFSGAQIFFGKQVTKCSDPSNAKICKFNSSEYILNSYFRMFEWRIFNCWLILIVDDHVAVLKCKTTEFCKAMKHELNFHTDFDIFCL